LSGKRRLSHHTCPLLGQNDEISGNIELLHLYAIVAVDVLLEIG
jgi:hypothetical protein